MHQCVHVCVYAEMTQETITAFFKSVTSSTNSENVVSPSSRVTLKALALFDPYRSSLRFWRAQSTEHVSEYVTDESILGSDDRMRRLVREYKGNVDVVLAFPPCTDLCMAGARWWKQKREQRPNFQKDAVEELRRLHWALNEIGSPFALVLPCSRHIVRQFPGSFKTSPHEFGGWLNKHDEHPLFPLTVPKQDAYSKRTIVFVGNGMRFPKRMPVTPIWVETVLKTGKIKRFSPVMAHRKKREARRCTPFGLCRALLERYCSMQL